MSNEHPIPKDLRDRFDQIEDAICRNRMERDSVFTQMCTAVQAYFMNVRAIPADIAELALELSKGKSPEQVKREVDQAIASFSKERAQ